MRRLQDDGDELDELFCYLVEMSANTARIIGYISADVFDTVSGEIDEGENYREGEQKYNWTSKADNYFAEADKLWLSFRND